MRQGVVASIDYIIVRLIYLLVHVSCRFCQVLTTWEMADVTFAYVYMVFVLKME